MEHSSLTATLERASKFEPSVSPTDAIDKMRDTSYRLIDKYKAERNRIVDQAQEDRQAHHIEKTKLRVRLIDQRDALIRQAEEINLEIQALELEHSAQVDMINDTANRQFQECTRLIEAARASIEALTAEDKPLPTSDPIVADPVNSETQV